MSPALRHVEQSRNTLSFATSAKEVTNNARVNVVCLHNLLTSEGKKGKSNNTTSPSKETQQLMFTFSSELIMMMNMFLS